MKDTNSPNSPSRIALIPASPEYDKIREALDSGVLDSKIPPVLLSPDQLLESLRNLRGKNINFENVLVLLFSFTGIEGSKYIFKDRNVVSIVRLLQEGRGNGVKDLLAALGRREIGTKYVIDGDGGLEETATAVEETSGVVARDLKDVFAEGEDLPDLRWGRVEQVSTV